MLASTSARINGIDLKALDSLVSTTRQSAGCATAGFRVTTRWAGQTRSESTIESFTCSGAPVKRNFTIVSDEPEALLGSDSAPNPQELLFSALNACMMVAYVLQATTRGITLTECRIETQSEIDLRGLLEVDEAVPPGARRISYIVHLEGDGSAEQYQAIHEAVMATSPNHFNLAQPIQMCGRLA